MKGLSGNGGSLTPQVRTRRRRAPDVTAARTFKMPPGRQDYTLTPAARVRMRDGVELLTDIYAPVTDVETARAATSLRVDRQDK